MEEDGDANDSAKNGSELYNPEDSFVDPNEIAQQDKKDEDNIWQEVDKELGTILDSNLEEEKVEIKKETPTRGGRARRGRKNN